MGRSYTLLSCGCCVSCDGGGGLIPCFSERNECKIDEYMSNHKMCDTCGECIVCFDHGDCKYKIDDFVLDVEFFLDDVINFNCDIEDLKKDAEDLVRKINKYMKNK